MNRILSMRAVFFFLFVLCGSVFCYEEADFPSDVITDPTTGMIVSANMTCSDGQATSAAPFFTNIVGNIPKDCETERTGFPAVADAYCDKFPGGWAGIATPMPACMPINNQWITQIIWWCCIANGGPIPPAPPAPRP